MDSTMRNLKETSMFSPKKGASMSQSNFFKL